MLRVGELGGGEVVELEGRHQVTCASSSSATRSRRWAMRPTCFEIWAWLFTLAGKFRPSASQWKTRPVSLTR